MEAVATARREIEHARVLTAREVGAAQAGIFDAHLLLLADAEMLADVKSRLRRRRRARLGRLDGLPRPRSRPSGRSSPIPTCGQRAADVRAVGEQVARARSTGADRASDDRLRVSWSPTT